MDSEQRELRRGLCTGTKVGAILGYSKWRTPFDIFAQAKGLVDDTPQTPAMRRGKALERGILDLYEEEAGVKLAREIGTLVHPTEDWIGGSPDGFYIDEDGCIVIVDAKTQLRRKDWGRPGTDDVPMTIQCQLQWYAPILSAHFGKPVSRLDVVTYFPWQDEISTFSIAPDHDTQQGLIERCRKWWWRHVISNVAPEIDHGSASANILGKITQERPNIVEIKGGDINVLKELVCIKDQIKTLEVQKKGLEAIIKSTIGEDAGIMGGGMKATWKEQSGASSWDTAAFREDHPELASDPRYKKAPKTYRVLRVTGKGESSRHLVWVNKETKQE